MAGTRPLETHEIDKVLTTLSSLRDRCLFLLGIKTGFRISELLSIKVLDCLQYNAIRSSITVSKANTKGKVASRQIPIGKELLSLLHDYVDSLPNGQVYLFQSQKGGRLSRHQAWRILKEAFKLNELSGNVATHSMRKTFANNVYNKLDKDLVKTQKAMGHKSINSTVSYLSFCQDEINKAILEL